MADTRYSLSSALGDDVLEFSDARAAGRAFAEADGRLGPRVIITVNSTARLVARSARTATGFAKAAPRLEAILAEPGPDCAFWQAYHETVLQAAA